MNFEYHLPVNILFGRGKLELLGKRAAQTGRKALLVTGAATLNRDGLKERIDVILRGEGVGYTMFGKVLPNPTTDMVIEGAGLAQTTGCDMVIAIGGGSVIDAAKGIAFRALEDEFDLEDYIFDRRSVKRALPVIAVPTTCGTGSEGNGFAVLTNNVTLDKKSVRSTALVPVCAIVDPELLKTMPTHLTAVVGFDAICHNIEAFQSRMCSPIVAAQCRLGLTLSARSLVRVCEGKGLYEDWDNLALASLLGGMSIGAAGVTLTHGMEHPVSGLKNITHGEGLAALAAPVIKHTLPEGRETYGEIAAIFGHTDIYECILDLLERLGLRVTLTGLGISVADIQWLTENCMKISANNLANHPRMFNEKEIAQIYQSAL